VFSCDEVSITVDITSAGAMNVRYGTPSMPEPPSTRTPRPAPSPSR